MNASAFDHDSECEPKSECVFEFESEFECVTMSTSVAFMMGWLVSSHCGLFGCKEQTKLCTTHEACWQACSD